MNIEQYNLVLFNQMNAGANLTGYQLALSIFAAKYLVYLVVVGLIGLWLWGSGKQRSTLLFAFSATMLALIINWLIGLAWFHPRPFMLGMGHTYLHHAPDSSFPSDHAAALCAIALIFLWRQGFGITTILLLLATLCVAWARIFVGVHFPFDMIGAFLVAIVSSVIIMGFAPLIERYLLPITENIYRKLFGKAIQLRWVKH